MYLEITKKITDLIILNYPTNICCSFLKKDVCFLHLLHMFKCTLDYFYHESKQYEPWSDCTSRISLIWVHIFAKYRLPKYIGRWESRQHFNMCLPINIGFIRYKKEGDCFLKKAIDLLFSMNFPTKNKKKIFCRIVTCSFCDSTHFFMLY